MKARRRGSEQFVANQEAEVYGGPVKVGRRLLPLLRQQRSSKKLSSISEAVHPRIVLDLRVVVENKSIQHAIRIHQKTHQHQAAQKPLAVLQRNRDFRIHRETLNLGLCLD